MNKEHHKQQCIEEIISIINSPHTSTINISKSAELDEEGSPVTTTTITIVQGKDII